MSTSPAPRFRCPNCGKSEFYQTVEPTKGLGLFGPGLLPGLGSFVTPAAFDVVVCASCGLTRFFASAEALARLSKSPKWMRLECEEQQPVDA